MVPKAKHIPRAVEQLIWSLAPCSDSAQSKSGLTFPCGHESEPGREGGGERERGDRERERERDREQARCVLVSEHSWHASARLEGKELHTLTAQSSKEIERKEVGSFDGAPGRITIHLTLHESFDETVCHAAVALKHP